MPKPPVLIVGAGIAGIACAQALRSAGVAARVVDGGRKPGGRMASRTINGRTVDLGAAYFTAEPGTGFGAVVLEWAARDWPPFHAAFINDVPELTSLADDGDRRGDAAPVLVAHATAALAREHLDDPNGAIAPAADAVQRMLGLTDAPVRSFAHRWTFARPAAQHPEPFLLANGIGVCADAWGERSSVATAWASGDALGRAIAGG